MYRQMTAAEFENKVAIITGASSGIGETTAVLFAKKGAKVVLVARNKEKLALVEKQCVDASKADNVLVIIADVNKIEDLKRVVDETVKKFKKIDILINNAGAGNPQSLLTTTPETFESIFNLNARAPFFLMQYCAPYLEQTKGNVVNVSSILSISGEKMFTSYAMAKAAMDQLTRCACVELGEKGIRVNSVNPGLIDTAFAEAAGAKDFFPIAAEKYAKSAPIGRYGQAIDVAECILFLASNKASFVDGISLFVDGGKTSTYALGS